MREKDVRTYDLIKEGVKSLKELGYYTKKEDIFKDAFRALLEIKPELRLAIAINLYRKEEISLNRAAEIAGVTTEEMKEILVGRGIKIKRDLIALEKRKEKAKELLKNRNR